METVELTYLNFSIENVRYDHIINKYIISVKVDSNLHFFNREIDTCIGDLISYTFGEPETEFDVRL